MVKLILFAYLSRVPHYREITLCTKDVCVQGLSTIESFSEEVQEMIKSLRGDTPEKQLGNIFENMLSCINLLLFIYLHFHVTYSFCLHSSTHIVVKILCGKSFSWLLIMYWTRT